MQPARRRFPRRTPVTTTQTTLESALKSCGGTTATCSSSDPAGSPRRIFLGSTAARILADVDVPVVVIPKAE